MSMGELSPVEQVAEQYRRLFQGATPPIDRDLDEVVHGLLTVHFHRWGYAVGSVEAMADDCDLRGWTKQANYVRVHVRRMEAER